MKNNLIIFSKNRACQLNLLLESIQINALNLFDKINVLYLADEEYKSGYNKLIDSHPNINYIEEVIFRRDLLELLSDEFDMTTFMVDDMVMFSPITNSKEDILGKINEECICFSLRLGENCTYSHPANINYRLGEHIIDGDYIILDFTKQSLGDFNYPLSVDGHIFNSRIIKDLITNTPFNNPNTLEANLQRFNLNIPKKITCFRLSKMVGIPVNLVNLSFNNRHGLVYYISEKNLNDRFMNNENIDLGSMIFDGINGPHKEIKYEFKKC